MTVSFALLESTIQAAIHFLLQEGQRIGQIVTAELSFKGLRALAISLCKERYGDGTILTDLAALMKRAADAEETRNQFTHSLWGAGAVAGTITRIKLTAKEKRGIHFLFENVDETRLKTEVENLKVLASDIQVFCSGLKEIGDRERGTSS
jgi:hypothetical protein